LLGSEVAAAFWAVDAVWHARDLATELTRLRPCSVEAGFRETALPWNETQFLLFIPSVGATMSAEPFKAIKRQPASGRLALRSAVGPERGVYLGFGAYVVAPFALALAIHALDGSGRWWWTRMVPPRPLRGEGLFGWVVAAGVDVSVFAAALMMGLWLSSRVWRERRLVLWRRSSRGADRGWTAYDILKRRVIGRVECRGDDVPSEVVLAWRRDRRGLWRVEMFFIAPLAALVLMFGLGVGLLVWWVLSSCMVRPPWIDHTVEPEGLRWSGLIRRDRFYRWDNARIELSLLTEDLWLMRVSDETAGTSRVILSADSVAYALDRIAEARGQGVGRRADDSAHSTAGAARGAL
jgi:hypothetical protein